MFQQQELLIWNKQQEQKSLVGRTDLRLQLWTEAELILKDELALHLDSDIVMERRNSIEKRES